MTRTFESGPARRERTQVTVGAVGYSGAGKTFSLLRFASGMAEADGGKTVVVDSNLKRSLYYAPKPGETAVRGQTFDFEVVHITPPFDPPSWGAAFEYAIKKLGATRVIADCMSDEWEGSGGVLDAHDKLVDEMIDRKRGKGDKRPEWELRDALSDAAWIKVKREHLALRLWMWQQPVHWLLSYRAKEKIDRKNKREELGWQPIGGSDIVYDLMLRCLLPPSSDGTPIWNPAIPAEKLLVKPPPGPIRELLKAHPQINEELGYQIARWASGHDIEIRPAGATPAPSSTATSGRTTSPSLADRFDLCAEPALLPALEEEARAGWKRLNVEQRDKVAAARTRATERFASRRAQADGEPGPITEEEAAEIRRKEAAGE